MLKFIYRFFLGLVALVVLASLGLWLSGNDYLFKGLYATYLHGEKSATIDDAQFFDTRSIPAGEGQAWALAKNYNSIPLSDSLKHYLEKTRSIAFLAIKRDSIISESYWGFGSDSSHSNSFSMAKSITSMLAQIAIQKGIFNSWEDKVQNYLPELKGPFAAELNIGQCSDMTAGLDWNEHYTNPFDITARAYYGDDIEETVLEHVQVSIKPGSQYEYQSGATQILGLCLREATGKSLAELASEWLWKPLGAEHEAFWQLDDDKGKELAYCCFNSNARDFARFGKLLLNFGNWDGQQILDSAYVKDASAAKLVDFYGRSFWIETESTGEKCFYMRGINGQYIMVIPSQDLVLVRLGHERLENVNHHPRDFYVYLQEGLRLFGD